MLYLRDETSSTPSIYLLPWPQNQVVIVRSFEAKPSFKDAWGNRVARARNLAVPLEAFEKILSIYAPSFPYQIGRLLPLYKKIGYCPIHKKEVKIEIRYPILNLDPLCPLCLRKGKLQQLQLGKEEELFRELLKLLGEENYLELAKKLKLNPEELEEQIEFAYQMGISEEVIIKKLMKGEKL
jgi:hypothetical protein